MLIALLPLTLALLWLIFALQLGAWRIGLLAALACCGGLIWLFTEVASLFNLISTGAFAAAWTATCLALAGVLAWRKRGRAWPALPTASDVRAFGWVNLGLLVAIAGICAVLGFVAVVAAPNNHDSMASYLARTLHWAQNGNVRPYPASYDAQAFHEPLAQFAFMHALLLAGNDQFVNLVQWGAMVCCAVGVSLIAKQLGGGARAQVVAALFSVTLPMGVLQATSTQYDYVEAVWMVCLTALALRVIQSEKLDWPAAVLVGLSAGGAMTSKATGRLYIAPVLIWVGLVLLRRYRARSLAPIALIAVLTLLLPSPHLTRNFELYGLKLIPEVRVGYYTNAVFTPQTLASNAIRNIALNFGLPRNDLNRSLIVQPVNALHAALGWDASDPDTTYREMRFNVSDQPFYENTAGNPLHAFLIVAALAIALVKPSLRRDRQLMIYALVVASMFALFCLALKWAPWNTRLHLPILVLWMPFVAVVFDKSLPKLLVLIACIVLAGIASQWTLRNTMRPLAGRNTILNTSRFDQYFKDDTTFNEPYRDAAKLLRAGHCRDIGLWMLGDTTEYPLWVMLNEGDEHFRFRHVNVPDETARTLASQPRLAFEPCAVVVSRLPTPETITIEERVFRRITPSRIAALYLPAVP